MSLTLTTAPDLLSDSMLDDVKAHLRRTDTADDSYITNLIDSAADFVEQKTGRALLSQTWNLTTDFCGHAIHLVLPPIQSVTSVKYLDPDGDEQTLASDAYRVADLGAWSTNIWPAFGETWPQTQAIDGAVTVEFVTGYGADADALPGSMKQAIREIVGTWYDQRSAVTITTVAIEIPLTATAALAPFKVFK